MHGLTVAWVCARCNYDECGECFRRGKEREAKARAQAQQHAQLVQQIAHFAQLHGAQLQDAQLFAGGLGS